MARILIVDDDPSIRASMRVVLEADGHVISEAPNGLAVESIVSESAPDLVLLDILMPAKDGIETIVGLRRAGHTVKIIAMSGRAGGPYMNFLGAAKRLGADAVLEKPFDGDVLRAAIAKVLGP
jgi:DNA-binding response OmpR family regulator